MHIALVVLALAISWKIRYPEYITYEAAAEAANSCQISSLSLTPISDGFPYAFDVCITEGMTRELQEVINHLRSEGKRTGSAMTCAPQYNVNQKACWLRNGDRIVMNPRRINPSKPSYEVFATMQTQWTFFFGDTTPCVDKIGTLEIRKDRLINPTMRFVNESLHMNVRVFTGNDACLVQLAENMNTELQVSTTYHLFG